MRILVCIPHYYRADPRALHGSGRQVARQRVQALAACLEALLAHFGPDQRMIHIGARHAVKANQLLTPKIKIIICTTGRQHLLADLPIASERYEQHETSAHPPLLGFECHAVLREHLGQHDYYVYLEDDLILQDAWFFAKLKWFTSHAGDDCLLQPNRFETSRQGATSKVYIDGDLRSEVTAAYQNVAERPILEGQNLGVRLHFNRALNPHAGCFFFE